MASEQTTTFSYPQSAGNVLIPNPPRVGFLITPASVSGQETRVLTNNTIEGGNKE